MFLTEGSLTGHRTQGRRQVHTSLAPADHRQARTGSLRAAASPELQWLLFLSPPVSASLSLSADSISGFSMRDRATAWLPSN